MDDDRESFLRRLAEPYVRLDQYLIDHVVQKLVNRLADHGVTKHRAAMAVLMTSVVPPWGMALHETFHRPINVTSILIDIVVPMILATVYAAAIREDAALAGSVFVRPLAFTTQRLARLAWFLFIVVEGCCTVLAIAEWTYSWAYFDLAWHFLLWVSLLILATRERPPARFRQEAPTGATHKATQLS